MEGSKSGSVQNINKYGSGFRIQAAQKHTDPVGSGTLLRGNASYVCSGIFVYQSLLTRYPPRHKKPDPDLHETDASP